MRLVIGILALSVGIVALGQERSSRPSVPQTPNIETQYDRFYDTTFVSTKGGDVRVISPHSDVRSMTITGSFSHKGTTLTSTARQFSLSFGTISYNWQFATDQSNLVAFADGKKVLKVPAKVADSHVLESSTLEIVLATISREEMEKLTRAKTVEMKIGSVEVRLTDRNIGDLRELFNRSAP